MATKKEAATFSKQQLLRSKRYAAKKDLLNALLQDKEYTVEQVDKILNDFLKGKV